MARIIVLIIIGVTLILESMSIGGAVDSKSSIISEWQKLDSSCKTSDITIKTASGARTWAGCNSNLGPSIGGKNNYNGRWCADVTKGPGKFIPCRDLKKDYGKLFKFDMDILGKCKSKTVGGGKVFGGGKECPCPSGWHIPSNQDWDQSITTLNNQESCLAKEKGLACPGLGYSGSASKSSDNNLVNKLQLLLPGFCASNSCQGRDGIGLYWTSDLQSLNTYFVSINSLNDKIGHGIIRNDYYSYSVRCQKDY